MGSRLTHDDRVKILKKFGKQAFACPNIAPEIGSYPLATPRSFPSPKQIVSARGYFRNPKTRKCRGGKTRICKVAKKAGLMKKDYPGSKGWLEWCK